MCDIVFCSFTINNSLTRTSRSLNGIRSLSGSAAEGIVPVKWKKLQWGHLSAQGSNLSQTSKLQHLHHLRPWKSIVFIGHGITLACTGKVKRWSCFWKRSIKCHFVCAETRNVVSSVQHTRHSLSSLLKGFIEVFLLYYYSSKYCKNLFPLPERSQE